MLLLIQNGHLVTEYLDGRYDMLINKGRVVAIESKIELSADQRAEATCIDVAGKFIFPGGVDAHTHMELPIRDFFSVDDFSTGTLAALAGGTTTIIDFANQARGESLHTTLDKWKLKAQKAHIPVYFHLSITDVNAQTLKEMEEVHQQRGINSFKTFLAYKGMRLNDEQLCAVLRRSRELGTLVTAHCEMGEQIEQAVEQFVADKKLAPRYHRLSRPCSVEAEATAHFLKLAALEKSPAYVVHMSNGESVVALQEAKERGQLCYGETCIQYLLLDSDLYEQDFSYASRYILSPPLRPKEHQHRLWEALQNGILDVVATDHCPFTTDLRMLGKNDFRLIPNGIGGVEERMILLFSEGVMKKRITRQRYVEVTATNPAKIFGLYPQKGTLQVGSDADFFIVDPTVRWKLSNEQLHHRCDYSCYEGYSLQGKIIATYLAGKPQG